MLDIKLIREQPDVVRAGILRKGEDPLHVDKALELDVRRRALVQQGEALKSRKNTVSQQVAAMKSKKEDATAVIAEMKGVSDEIKAIDEELKVVEENLRGVMLQIPNLPDASVPDGKMPEDNKPIAHWGAPPVIDFTPKPHWDLIKSLGLIDFDRGTKITGAGFPVYVGKGAKLERALISFFLDHATASGYTELLPPLMVNADSATGTGQLPDKEGQMYVAQLDGFYLVPTAEVPVTNFYRDEILGEEVLPVKLCAYTPCFRREAGSYGKDVRGLNRLHQFDKVELVNLVHPTHSMQALEDMRTTAEQLLQKLGLHYRTLLMCAGDLGFTQVKKYDLEVWSVGQQRWLEVSSVSNFEAFQARRLNIRYRPAGGGKPEMVHTLNGSSLALPRIVAALLEHYQTPEGKVIVPSVLHSYTGFEVIG
jgi:seryl-tRNA synthetase